MNDRYKIFSKGFNRVLDLVETYNDEFYNFYKSIIDDVDEVVLSAIEECEDFATGFSRCFCICYNGLQWDEISICGKRCRRCGAKSVV